MELTLTKKSNKPGRFSIPTKRSINLANAGQKKTDLKKAIPALILVVAAAVLISKFAVLDRIIAMNEAEAAASRSRQMLDDGYATIDSYGELTETYAHYTYSGMTDSEMQRINRVDVINMVERVVYSKADVDGFQITGNKLVLTLRDKDLRGANAIAQELMLEDMVDFCTVNQVKTADRVNTMLYNGVDNEFILAQITVNLIGSLEVEYDR